MYTSEKYQLIDYSEGTPGKDGSDIEYVYYRCAGTTKDPAPTEGPTYNNDGKLTPDGWKASPQGITLEEPYEYVSIRTKPAGTNTEWGEFSTPTLWAKWGDKGMDGDGVEYLFYIKNEEIVPDTPKSLDEALNSGKWKDEPTGVTKDNRFEYVCVVTTTHENGVEKLTFATPVLWTKYSEDGAAAKDFNITASAYALKKGENGKYLNSITLTAHRINITDEIKWYEGNIKNNTWKEITSDDAKDNTLLIGTSLGTGDYKATCGKFEDHVTIVEIKDGEIGPDGKPAISIVLSNPNMTFHAPTTGKSEQCQVIVYEGGNQLESDKGQFTITKKTDGQNKASIDGSIVTVTEPSNDGSCDITINIKSSDGTTSTQDMAINWKIIADGDQGDTSGTVTLYKGTNTSAVPTERPSGTDLDGWSEDELSLGGEIKYIWKINGTFTQKADSTTKTYGDKWTTPELHSAYVENATGQQGAEFLKLFGMDAQQQGLGYTKNPDGITNKLYINAEMIQTGQLTVRKDPKDIYSDLLFSAGWNNYGMGSVKMAGWEVNKDFIKKDNTLIHSGTTITRDSLTTKTKSPIRFSAGMGHIYKYPTEDESYPLENFWGFEGNIIRNCVISTPYLPDNARLIDVRVYVNMFFDGEKHVDTNQIKCEAIVVSRNAYDLIITGSLDRTPSNAEIEYEYAFTYTLIDDIPFAVLEDGSLYASSAKIAGNIIATSGKICNWIIGNVPVRSGSDSKPTGLYYIHDDSNYPYNLGFALNPGQSGDPVLWASDNATPPWAVPDVNTWKKETKFFVTGRGDVNCQNLIATGGQIGPFLINELGLDYDGEIPGKDQEQYFQIRGTNNNQQCKTRITMEEISILYNSGSTNEENSKIILNREGLEAWHGLNLCNLITVDHHNKKIYIGQSGYTIVYLGN